MSNSVSINFMYVGQVCEGFMRVCRGVSARKSILYICKVSMCGFYVGI